MGYGGAGARSGCRTPATGCAWAGVLYSRRRALPEITPGKKIRAKKNQATLPNDLSMAPGGTSNPANRQPSATGPPGQI